MQNALTSVQLYYLPLRQGASEEMLRLPELLPESVREKIRRLPVHKGLPALFAQLLLRETLQTVTGLPAEELQISLQEFGKPYLVNQPMLHFNYSHTESAVALALFERPVGVDIEKIRPVRRDFAQRFFAPSEMEYVEKTALEREERLIEIWTMKEAYIKLLGAGLRYPLRSFSVLEPPLSSRIETYRMEDCYLSVARDTEAPVIFTEKTQEEIKSFAINFGR